MIHFFYAIFLSISTLANQNETAPFRFHTAVEPVSIDPIALNEPGGGFLFNNLFRGLYRLNSKLVPVPDLAEICRKDNDEKLRWTCKLRKDAKFSDGSPITSKHYIQSWQRMLDKSHPSKNVELLLSVKNAKKILAGELSLDQLGVRAIDEWTIQVELEYDDLDWLYKISSPLLTALAGPVPNDKNLFGQFRTTGPYSIEEWLGQSRIRLKSNLFYKPQFERPPVEVLVVEEDTTALHLYDLGKLDFLRRVTIKEYPQRKKETGFLFTPFFRFDFMGFGPRLMKDKHLRRALALSLNYPELTKAYETPGQIGCPSLGKTLASPWPCLKQNLKEAKREIQLADQQLLKTPIHLHYSSGGGDDVQRGMEWMQTQWSKNLGVLVELHPMETGAFLNLLKTSPPDIYRRGFNLDRPKCLAALEKFHSTSKDNYSKIENPLIDRWVLEMQQTENPVKARSLCGSALSELLREPLLIPLGELYIAMLAKPTFVGWRVTPLNQLDLTELRQRH